MQDFLFSDFLLVFDLFKMNNFNNAYVAFYPMQTLLAENIQFYSSYLYTYQIQLPIIHFSFDTLMTMVS